MSCWGEGMARLLPLPGRSIAPTVAILLASQICYKNCVLLDGIVALMWGAWPAAPWITATAWLPSFLFGGPECYVFGPVKRNCGVTRWDQQPRPSLAGPTLSGQGMLANEIAERREGSSQPATTHNNHILLSWLSQSRGSR